MEISLTQCPRQLQHPDKNWRQPSLSELQSEDRLQTQWEGFQTLPRHYWEASDMWLAALTPSQNTVCHYISPSLKERAFRRNPATRTGVPSPRFTRDLQIRVEHQGGSVQEGNDRRMPSGLEPVQQTLKKHQVPAQDLRGEPSVTQAENSPSNIPLPDTCQWHLITSVLPSASLSRHLDQLPSHRWLCWTNLESPRPYVASPMGTWHKETSLTVHLMWLMAPTWAILWKNTDLEVTGWRKGSRSMK